MSAYYLALAIAACIVIQVAASLTIGRQLSETVRISTGVLIVITITALLTIPRITDPTTVLIITTLFAASGAVRIFRERFDAVSQARKELATLKRELEKYAQPNQQ